MEFQFHPLADLFPLLEGREFDDLVADIKVNGLREPITLLGGRILDGRNRYRACHKAGVEVRHRDFHRDDAAAFVVSMNLHRRHLNESQRAMVALKIASLKRGGDWRSEEAKSANLRLDTSRAEAAKVLNVSERSIDSAAAVAKKGVPELVQAVEQGKVRLSRATKIAELPPAKQRVMAETNFRPSDAGTKPKRERETASIRPATAAIIQEWLRLSEAEKLEFVSAVVLPWRERRSGPLAASSSGSS
jgi:ParB-like chromosome segregation protein Spo0J